MIAYANDSLLDSQTLLGTGLKCVLHVCVCAFYFDRGWPEM